MVVLPWQEPTEVAGVALGKASQGAAAELNCPHFLKQLGEQIKEGKKITAHGHWLPDWCSIYFISFNDFTTLTREMEVVSDWGTSSSSLCFRFHHRPFQSLFHTPIPKKLLPFSNWLGAKDLHTHWPIILFPGGLSP